MNEQIDLDIITPLHEPGSSRKLRELAKDMKENGWAGRPLLVIERDSDFYAWTGSHRIAAAKLAGWDSVPCYVLQEADLVEHGFDAEHGHVDDTDRLKILRVIGDETAIHLMWQEGRD